MIEQPTVFILGAGASIPFNFPSGLGLIKHVNYQLRDNTSIPYHNIIQMQKSHEDITEFVDALVGSGMLSVDAFLERRPEFMEIGKIAIASILIPFEDLSQLFQPGVLHWYNYLYNHKLNSIFEDFHLNKVSFITFNYDRSLEQFLFHALKNSHNKENQEVADQLSKIPIIHLYGKLGELEWQGKTNIPYHYHLNKGERTTRILKESGNNLKIISEDVGDDQEFAEAKNLMDNARRIYFMGFGYNKTNLDRLKITQFRSRNDIQFAGTAYEMKHQEIREVESITGTVLPESKLFPGNCLDFLREFAFIA